MNESQINVSINIRFHSGDKCLRKNEETPYPLPSAPFPKRKKRYNFSPIFKVFTKQSFLYLALVEKAFENFFG